MFTGKYEYDPDGVNRIIDERGNSFIAMRMVRWKEDNEFELDIRKYRLGEDGTETPNKGIKFLTEDGPCELMTAMIEEGYGDTITIADSLFKNRKDICERIIKLDKGEVELFVETEDEDNEDYYDPREIDLS